MKTNGLFMSLKKEPSGNMDNHQQCSELFKSVFFSHCSGIRRQCACGITYFNGCDKDYFDEGEFEDLKEKAKKEPSKYIERDHDIGTLEIGGFEIVLGCTCNIASKYEKFILFNAEKIAEFLQLKAIELRNKANKIDIPI